mgnify:FL=1
MTEDMAYAKQLFLYGDGASVPIKNLTKLSEKAGVSRDRVKRYVKEWRALSTELALSNPNSPYSLSLSEDTLVQHREEIDFLGKQVSKLRFQLKELDPMTANYHVMIGSYQSALTKWEKSSGILAHYNTAESAMKERARAYERAKGKEGNDLPTAKRKVDKSRFDI